MPDFDPTRYDVPARLKARSERLAAWVTFAVVVAVVALLLAATLGDPSV